eukprot:15182994-Ditylum_brightwellii.AAC.1
MLSSEQLTWHAGLMPVSTALEAILQQVPHGIGNSLQNSLACSHSTRWSSLPVQSLLIMHCREPLKKAAMLESLTAQVWQGGCTSPVLTINHTSNTWKLQSFAACSTMKYRAVGYIQHIPGAHNVAADALSHYFRLSDDCLTFLLLSLVSKRILPQMQVNHTSWIYSLMQIGPSIKDWSSPPARSTHTTGPTRRSMLCIWAFQTSTCGYYLGTRNCTCFRHLWKQCTVEMLPKE